MPDHSRDSSERLSLIIETQREIARAGNDLEVVMQLVAERSQAITGADGAMVNLLDGDMLQTRAVSGIAAGALDARRPLSSSVARYAIESGQPLLIEDAPSDLRINQDLRAKVGDKSLICVPTSARQSRPRSSGAGSGSAGPARPPPDHNWLRFLPQRAARAPAAAESPRPSPSARRSGG